MSLIPHPNDMRERANGYWKALRIDSAEEFKDWQWRFYLPDAGEDALVRDMEQGTVSEQRMLQLAPFWNAKKMQTAARILCEVIPKNFKNIHQALDQEGRRVADIETVYSALEPLCQLLFAFQSALNPLGSREMQPDALLSSAMAVADLYDKSRVFLPQDYDDYYKFALRELEPYLPQEYNKLLQMACEQQRQAPATTVAAETINPAIETLIREIAKSSKGGPSSR